MAVVWLLQKPSIAMYLDYCYIFNTELSHPYSHLHIAFTDTLLLWHCSNPLLHLLMCNCVHCPQKLSESCRWRALFVKAACMFKLVCLRKIRPISVTPVWGWFKLLSMITGREMSTHWLQQKQALTSLKNTAQRRHENSTTDQQFHR